MGGLNLERHSLKLDSETLRVSRCSLLRGGSTMWSRCPSLTALSAMQICWLAPQVRMGVHANVARSWTLMHLCAAPHADTPFALHLNQSGIYHYACSVSGHCQAGMLITVQVAGELPVLEGSQPAFAAHRRRPLSSANLLGTRCWDVPGRRFPVQQEGC